MDESLENQAKNSNSLKPISKKAKSFGRLPSKDKFSSTFIVLFI